uniref:Uncharacterized protein n=1 Tax=Rhizophora mucronata TaxID=61149 RepID=A0A2P2Q9Y1_RHIMU
MHTQDSFFAIPTTAKILFSMRFLTGFLATTNLVDLVADKRKKFVHSCNIFLSNKIATEIEST